MQENNSFLSTWKSIGIASLLLGIITMLLFRVEVSYPCCLLLLAAALWIVRPMSLAQWTAIDWCLSLITFYDIASCLYAVCSYPAVCNVFLSVFCLTSYFVVRKLFVCGHSLTILLQGSYVPIGIALLLGFCSFFIFRQSVWQVGFEDTYPFRFLFRPLGYFTNEWAEVLILLLGWVCMVHRYSGLFVFLLVLAILLSFSRGAYMALGTYVMAWVAFVQPKREKIRLLMISIIAVALTGIFFQSELKTTLQMNRTRSQQQSTEGRLNAVTVAWNRFQERPWFGYGNGNYTFAVDGALYQDSTRAYTSYAPNLLIQLLIEKGIIGILLYLWLIVAICRMILKQRECPDNRITGCVLLALAVKEMTQATLFSAPFALFMLYVLLAFLGKEKVPVQESESRQPLARYILLGMVAVCYGVWVAWGFFQKRDQLLQQRSIQAYEKGDVCEAIRLMELTQNQVHGQINRSLLYRQCYRKTKEQKYMLAAEQALRQANRRQPEDIQIRYMQARLYIDAANLDDASAILKELIKAYPKNSLYLSAFSEILYQKGKKEGALNVLIKAICYTPRLLTGRRIRDLQQTDPFFYHTLKQRLSALQPATNDTPIDYARYGYIAHWCGNQFIADIYLLKAVEDMPNLATPWHLLGDDNKYRLLQYGAFYKNLLSAELLPEQEMTDELLFKMQYQGKFQNWYGNELFFLSGSS